jgi:hypothetical protein
MNQSELEEFAAWCFEHLNVNTEVNDDWKVMSLCGKKIMSARMDSQGYFAEEYRLEDTDMSAQVVSMYNTWKGYVPCS